MNRFIIVFLYRLNFGVNMDILLQRIQHIPVGRFHYQLLILIGLGWLFDAMDTGLIAFIMASLSQEWGLTASQKAMIVSITFVGMALGAIFAGKLADLIGRKKVFIATLLIYSVATGLCAFASDLTMLLIFRFIVGIGLGGQLPVAVSLMSEYLPAQVRGRFIVLLESFWGLGWLVAALIAYFFIPTFGWKMAFLIGGLPLFYALILWKKLPESIYFLVNRQRYDEAHQILCTIEKQAKIPVVEQLIIPPLAQKQQHRFIHLWSSDLWKRSFMLWCLWFGIVFSYYGIFTWLPSLLVQQGFTIVHSFEYVLTMILAQLPGYLVAAWCVEKFGRKLTLAGFISCCAVSAYFFGQAQSVEVLMFWGCLMSFFNLGAWGVVYTYTSELYPTSLRAFGSGWASAIGRIGGIVAPLVVTQMMTFNNAFHHIFMMFTAVMFAIAILVMILGEETKGKQLESI